MTPEEKNLWIMKKRCEVDDAICLLISAKKQRVSEYDERLRKFRDEMDKLRIKNIDQQSELFDPDETLPPEMVDLLADPTRGLT
jgi:hypothetical protein